MPTRRSFLRRSARALAVAAIAPQIVPSGVLSLHGQPGANGRLVTGHIGLGPRGRELLRHFKDVAALCDVDQRRLAAARTEFPEATSSAEAVQDYRRVLERQDIDAVVIATPDHWHALMALEACQAGKHVYLETPVARSLAEGNQLQRVVANTKRCVQVGGQGPSNPLGFAACQVIRAGLLGDIQRIECWHPPDLRQPSQIAQPAPKELDWNLWLGPLKEREFDEQLFSGGWRFAPDIGGGALLEPRHMGLGILLELELAALPGHGGKDCRARGLESGVIVAGDVPDPAQATLEKALQEGPPVKLGFAQGDVDAEPNAFAVGRDAQGEEDGAIEQLAVLPDLFRAGVDEQAGKFTERSLLPHLEFGVKESGSLVSMNTGSPQSVSRPTTSHDFSESLVSPSTPSGNRPQPIWASATSLSGAISTPQQPI